VTVRTMGTLGLRVAVASTEASLLTWNAACSSQYAIRHRSSSSSNWTEVCCSLPTQSSRGNLELNGLSPGQHTLQTAVLRLNRTERDWQDELVFEVPEQGTCNFSIGSNSSEMYNPEQYSDLDRLVTDSAYNYRDETTQPNTSPRIITTLASKLAGPPTAAPTVSLDITLNAVASTSSHVETTALTTGQADSNSCSEQWSDKNMAVIAVLATLVIILIALNVAQYVMIRRTRRPMVEGVSTDELYMRGFKPPKLPLASSVAGNAEISYDQPVTIGSYLDVLANGSSVDTTAAEVMKRNPESRPISVRPDSLLEDGNGIETVLTAHSEHTMLESTDFRGINFSTTDF